MDQTAKVGTESLEEAVIPKNRPRQAAKQHKPADICDQAAHIESPIEEHASLDQESATICDPNEPASGYGEQANPSPQSYHKQTEAAL